MIENEPGDEPTRIPYLDWYAQDARPLLAFVAACAAVVGLVALLGGFRR